MNTTTNLVCLCSNLFVAFIPHLQVHNSFMYSLCESSFRLCFTFYLLHLLLNSNSTLFKSISDVFVPKFINMHLSYKSIKFSFAALFHPMIMLLSMFILLYIFNLFVLFLKNCKYISIFSCHGGKVIPMDT